jgi:hypothetical protein
MSSSLQADGFHLQAFNEARPFSSFLPGVAGAEGKPMWVFYCNRGQCIASFGVRDRNGAMLEFQPANKAYALTPLLGFRSFLRIAGDTGATLHEPFVAGAAAGITQRMCVRAEELEIEELHPGLGLRMRVVYFTLPGEDLPVLVRRVTLENTGLQPLRAEVLDGLPQIVPFGLEEKLLKQLSRTMEAFAEVRHADQGLPFFKLKVEPSDKPEVQWIEGGFFAFTLRTGRGAEQHNHEATWVPLLTDPELVFGTDTSLRHPLPFARGETIAADTARSDTLTGCAFAHLRVALEPGASMGWASFFGQAPDWETARRLRARVTQDASYPERKQRENTALISELSGRFALLAGPAQLAPYTRQAFLDNTLRGGQPVVVNGPRGPRVFHTFTRKHGDMERDYNAFELSPTYWSQGNANFRDVNQNRRCENFIYPEVDAANVETFFALIQLDGNNPLVVQAETFCVPAEQLAPLAQDWPAGLTTEWQAFLTQPFSPGQLLALLIQAQGTAQAARPWFDRIVGQADKIQNAAHGEGYWVDHWIYNLDLLDSYAALYPDRLRHLLVERADFTTFDNDHIVLPRDQKYVLRKDGSVRQLHAVVRDTEKTRQIAQRKTHAQAVHTANGLGPVYRSTLLAKLLGLLAVKATLFDPCGLGLEMEAEKPGWCDALNGLPGLVGSSTHEAFALQRAVAFVQRAVEEHLLPDTGVQMAVEVAALLRSVTEILAQANGRDFLPTWQQLATRRESFRADVRLGVAGDLALLPSAEVLHFLRAVDAQLARSLAGSVDAAGLPVSYYTHEIAEFDVLPSQAQRPGEEPTPTFVRARRFVQKPIAAFLEGAVHALRSSTDADQARALYGAVRRSSLYDSKLGMYRVNVPLDAESFEIGRSKIFSPGWLENESIFLHMHYKYLLETLRSGLSDEFFQDLRRGLVAFHDPAVYGRSPLENSSFIASSRFPDPKVHGMGFVARLSGATAEWISMLLHMSLGAAPFRQVDGALRFEPRPTLADWLFTSEAVPGAGFASNSFGIKLFGQTWLVYENPARRATFGPGAASPKRFELRYANGQCVHHEGQWLPSALALDVRSGELLSVVIGLE